MANQRRTSSPRWRRASFTVAAVLALCATGAAAQVYLSNRCFTRQFWCFMQQAAPIGAQFWCGSPYGPVPGVVR